MLTIDSSGRVASPLRASPSAPRRGPLGQRSVGLRVVLQRLTVTAPSVLRSPFVFQCAPTSDFPQQYAWDWIDYDTISDGKHSRPVDGQLASVTFGSLFVDADAPYVVASQSSFNPVLLVRELREIGDSMSPFQLIAGKPELWGIDYDINMAVTLRSFTPRETAGEPDARYFDASFTEFRGVSLAAVTSGALSPRRGVGTAASLAAGGVRSPSGSNNLASLTVADLPPGRRTLREIAKHYYGDPTLWRLIAQASGLDVAGDQDLRVALANVKPSPKIIVPRIS